MQIRKEQRTVSAAWVARWVQCSLHHHEDLNSETQHPCKNSYRYDSTYVVTQHWGMGFMEMGDLQSLLISQISRSLSSSLSERPY